MVFTHELDRNRHPIGTRLWGVCIGSWLMGAIAVCMASPRTIAFTLPVLVLTLIVSYVRREGLSFSGISGLARITAPALIFGAFAMLSAAWAEQYDAALGASGAAFLWLIIGIVGAVLINREPRHNQFHMAEGLWIGLIAGLLYLLVEILSGQAIKIFLYNFLEVPKAWLRPPSSFTWVDGKVVAIAPFDLTRSIAPIGLMIWPALLCLKISAPRNNSVAWCWMVYGLAALVIMLSEHQTSKVAIIAASFVFVLSRWNAKWAAWFLRVSWVTACLAVIPLALTLYRANVHQAEWLQRSAQHRIIIWNNTAEYALKKPIAGVGAGMMYVLDGEGEMAPETDERMHANARHAHNVFLQTWFEMGAIGAALLALLGLGTIEIFQTVSRSSQPYGHAMFAAVMCLAAASYGMWQAWFLAMFAFAAVCYSLAVGVNRRGSLADQSHT